MIDISLETSETNMALLRTQLEAEITQQALILFKDLRREYSNMNERLQARVAELEKQRAEHTQQIDDLALALKGALRKENVALSREVAELRLEVDGFREVIRD